MKKGKELVSWLNGYVDGVTSVNGMTNGHPTFSARAYVIEDVNKDIDAVLSNYYSEACSSLNADFPDLDVVEYQFEPAEVHMDWIRWLHQELEQRLLPSPCVAAQDSSGTTLDKTRYHVAWDVMEVLRMITQDFATPSIYRARYTRGTRYIGCVFAIPLQDAYLVLNFQEKAKAS